MNLAYLFVVLTLSLIGTLFVDRKHIATPYICALPFLPGSVQITAGPFSIWGTDLLSVSTFFLIVLRGGLAPPFKVSFIDVLLPAMCCWRAICLVVAGEDASTMVQGFARWFSPIVIPYLIGRIGCCSWEGMKTVIKGALFAGLIVTAFTAFEALTGRNVLGLIGLSRNPEEIKWGLWRSRATFGSLHILGMYLAFLSILSLSLYVAARRKMALFIFLILVTGSVLSTAATGVMLAGLGIGFMCLYPVRNYYRVWGLGILALMVFVHFVSSDGIHYVFARRLGFMGQSYYRARLVDEVIARMANRWLFGLGNEHVTLPFLSFEDICNMWLYFLARAGLPGFLCWSVLYLFLLVRLRDCYRFITDYQGERLFIWGIIGALFSLGTAFNYIALYGSDIALFTFFFGLIVSLPGLATHNLDTLKRLS